MRTGSGHTETRHKPCTVWCRVSRRRKDGARVRCRRADACVGLGRISTWAGPGFHHPKAILPGTTMRTTGSASITSAALICASASRSRSSLRASPSRSPSARARTLRHHAPCCRECTPVRRSPAASGSRGASCSPSQALRPLRKPRRGGATMATRASWPSSFRTPARPQGFGWKNRGLLPLPVAPACRLKYDDDGDSLGNGPGLWHGSGSCGCRRFS